MAPNRLEHVKFSDALAERVLLFDGAMGTCIQSCGLHASDYPDGADGFNDGLTLSRPDIIKSIHESYLDAGADCIETNTFGSNTLKLDEYGHGKRTVEVNQKAAELARESCDKYDGRYVVGTMGPTGYLPSTDDDDLGQISLDAISSSYKLQAEGLLRGGVDAILIETSQDILEVKLAVEGARQAITDRTVPLIANVTLMEAGTMLLGTPVDAAYTTSSGMDIDAFGLNCSTGPREMEQSVRWLGEESDIPILVMPNAGMPENDSGVAVYKMTPKEMAAVMKGFLRAYSNVRMIGGCCGTTTEHILELRHTIDTL